LTQSTAEYLRALAADMDGEYQKLCERQHVDKLGRRRSASGSSEAEIQIGGRLDALAWWAAHIRCLAERAEAESTSCPT